MSLLARIESLPRASGVTDRQVVVALAGRFMDELLSGLPNVLMPTLRSQLGLSLSQVGLLSLSLNYVAAFVEPVSALLIDIWRRPLLMALGAAGIGLSTVIIGLAPTFGILLLGFAAYGLTSGALAHTADVVLVEAYPEAPDRIYTRATLLDTAGALLAPLLVSLTFFLGLEWRWLMVALGLSSVVYAIVIIQTRFARPVNVAPNSGQSNAQTLLGNLKAVLTNRRTLAWILFLFVYAVLEAPMTFTTIWLREQVGLSQAQIGLYRAFEMAVGIVSLAILDRWLVRSGYRRVLLVASLALIILYPAWLLTPGIWTRFLLAVPLSFFFAVYWPIGKAQSLASAPGRGGAVTAVLSLFGLVPIPLLFGMVAERITLTTAMLWVHLGAMALLVLLVWKMPDDRSRAANNH